MIKIDDDDEETFEDKLFEKADYIGEILIGERKLHLTLPKKQLIKIQPRPKKPSKFNILVSDFKTSITKYKTMSLSRLIGLGMIGLIIIFILSIIIYLLLSLFEALLKLGLIGFVVFAILLCTLCASGVLIIATRYSHK